MFSTECKVCAELVMDKGTPVHREGWGLAGVSFEFYWTWEWTASEIMQLLLVHGTCLPLSRSNSLIPLTSPHFLVVSCPYCSYWIRSHCENSVSFLLTHRVQCLINNFSIFCAKCLSKSPLWMLWGSAIIHNHCVSSVLDGTLFVRMWCCLSCWLQRCF